MKSGHDDGVSGHVWVVNSLVGMQIKELEDDLAKARQRQDQIYSELQLKGDRVAALEQELARAKSATQSRAQLASQTEITQLELLLDDELAKVLLLLPLLIESCRPTAVFINTFMQTSVTKLSKRLLLHYLMPLGADFGGTGTDVARAAAGG